MEALQGDWKISGFGLSTYLKLPDGSDARWTFPEYDHRLPQPVQKDLDYIAPEYALDEQLQTANDMYALGCIVHSIHTKGGPPFSNRGSVENLRRNAQDIGVLRAGWSRLGDEVQGLQSMWRHRMTSLNILPHRRCLVAARHSLPVHATDRLRLPDVSLLLLQRPRLYSRLPRPRHLQLETTRRAGPVHEGTGPSASAIQRAGRQEEGAAESAGGDAQAHAVALPVTQHLLHCQEHGSGTCSRRALLFPSLTLWAGRVSRSTPAAPDTALCDPRPSSIHAHPPRPPVYLSREGDASSLPRRRHAVDLCGAGLRYPSSPGKGAQGHSWSFGDARSGFRLPRMRGSAQADALRSVHAREASLVSQSAGG